VGDAVDVGRDGVGREIAVFHILDHSLTKRCHDALLAEVKGAETAVIMIHRRGVGTDALVIGKGRRGERGMSRSGRIRWVKDR
jgi:hypothetical protein